MSSLATTAPPPAPAPAPDPPRRPGNALVLAIWAFTTLGILYLWFVLFAVAGSSLAEAHDQHGLYEQLTREFALETAPTGGVISPDSPVAVLRYSRLGHQQVIVEGTSGQDLRHGPGHERDSVLPGQLGVSVVFGRAVTYGAPFAHLAQAEVGDQLTVTTQQGTFTFKVIDIRHSGSPLPPTLTAGQARLTLVTALGAGWRAGWAPNTAELIDADLVGKAAIPTAPHVVAVPPQEAVLASDPDALAPLAAWLIAGLATVLGLTWAWVRWGRWQTWLIGLPLIVASLWGIAAAGVQLLPNLL